jgi:hypothetical protein
MNYYIVPAALIVALVITLAFSVLFKKPLGGLWIFFFLLFLLTWAGQLWITPFGPVSHGIGWASLLLVPLFFGLLMFTMVPPVPLKKPDALTTENKEEEPLIAMGVFFWIVIFFLILSVIFGYYTKSYSPVV